jgi:hypothetical protein
MVHQEGRAGGSSPQFPLIRTRQPLGEDRHEVAVDTGEGLSEILKIFPTKNEHIEIGGYANRGRHRLPCNDRHVAQDSTGANLGNVVSGDKYLGRTRLDNKHLLGDLALREQDGPLRILATLEAV